MTTAKPLPSPVIPSSPTSLPQFQRDQLVQYMLSLINKDRQAAGLLPVILGTNNASQKHAEEMLANGYLSHWGLDGMKPYIRYTLAGGYNYEAENISAPDSFINENGLYAKKDILQRLGEVEQGLMDSPGHKKNILNK